MDPAARWLALVLAAAVAGAAAGVAGVPAGDPVPAVRETRAADPCVGTVTEPATGTTVVSVQGARGAEKKTARLVAVGPRGRVRWVRPTGDRVVWSYDVDPLPDGDLFVTATLPGRTLVYELDPRTGERVWSKTFDATDTHDADLVEGGEEILVANMRNYDAASGENRDRVFIYNRSTGEVVWEYRFAAHPGRFPPAGGGAYADDWTHVNDVEYVDGDVLASVRNFDQVVLIDRGTKEIEWTLGSDDDHSTLFQQHNPDHLRGRGGRPTVLVADSENDRVVEYARSGGGWERTWTLTGAFEWPRDADRLPDGNTLVVDSRNHRVVEVTPQGRVVWEVYTPWLPYDAERVRAGAGSRGPTVAEQNARGAVALSGDAGRGGNRSALEACADALGALDRSTATPYPPEGGPGTVALTRTPYAPAWSSPFGDLLALVGLGAAVAVLIVALAVRFARRERARPPDQSS